MNVIGRMSASGSDTWRDMTDDACHSGTVSMEKIVASESAAEATAEKVADAAAVSSHFQEAILDDDEPLMLRERVCE